MARTRFVIEGTWIGYKSSQDRIVHREVTQESGLALWVQKTRAIAYTDGTTLELSCRPCRPREKVRDLVNGYGSLIRDCRYYDVASVAALIEAKKAAR